MFSKQMSMMMSCASKFKLYTSEVTYHVSKICRFQITQAVVNWDLQGSKPRSEIFTVSNELPILSFHLQCSDHSWCIEPLVCCENWSVLDSPGLGSLSAPYVRHKEDSTLGDLITSTHFCSVWNQRGSGKWQDVHERLDKLCLSHPSPEVFIREDQTLEDECEQVIQTGMIRNFGEGTGIKIAIWELITSDELFKQSQISTLKNI